MITEVLGTIATIAQKIYAQVKLAEANQAQFAVLKNRVDIIVKAIKDLDKQENADRYKPGLLALKSCLDDVLKFTGEFAKNKAWYQKLLKAGTAEEQFKKINEQLQKSIEQLNLGMIAQQIIDHEKDNKARELDAAFIKNNEEKILKLNQKAIDEMQRMKAQNLEHNAILVKQLASMRAQLNGQHKKEEIELHLRVPYYELMFDETIGEGSFGKVYQGKWCEQAVAIKTIDGLLSAADREQFVREVQIMARLRSAHIVQLYGASLEPERLCLVMEHMEQGSLYTVLGKAPLTPEQQKPVALEIAKGLAYLHSRGMVHCDLKSANILLNAKGEAKIADFGLSKASTKSIKVCTEKSQAIEWQAPECLQKNPKFTPESDIFAYGMILWEIVTGQRPFEQIKTNRTKAILDLILAGKRESIPANTPPIYKQIIEACWNREQHKRLALKTIIAKLEAYNPNVGPEDYYNRGIEFEKNKKFSEAFTNYKKAVDLRHIKAHTNLGFCYLQGQGVKKDPALAIHYLTIGAEKGHLRAMNNLAAIYKHGQGVPQNNETALMWYKRAAELGDLKAKAESVKLLTNMQTVKNEAPPSTAAITGTGVDETRTIEVEEREAAARDETNAAKTVAPTEVLYLHNASNVATANQAATTNPIANPNATTTIPAALQTVVVRRAGNIQ